MRVLKNKKVSRTLLVVNAILLFVISFQLGGKIAAAQSKSYNTNANAPATAQFPEFKEQISSTITPENPGPQTDTVISLEVYSFDINSAVITWKRDGKVISQGIGQKELNFKTGNSGVTTKIDVTIDPRDRPVITRSFTFVPNEVDLLWQANTYSHPFYKGKNMYTPEANVTFIALPRSSSGNINIKETVFNWTENYKKQADKSGFGKSTYSYDGPIILGPAQITVETHSPGQGTNSQQQVATADIELEPTDAGILIYEDNPALGILFNKALYGNMTLNKNEIKLAAYPYFQTAVNKNLNLEYKWVIDGYLANISKQQNSVVLKKVEGDQGQSSIEIESTNPLKILQTTSNSLQIKFDNRAASGNSSGFGQE